MSNKKIYAVSGSWPPEICGVGDYMNNLVEDLLSKSISVERITLKKYSIIAMIKLIIYIRLNKDCYVFVSYPTEGYGRSVLPFFVSLVGSNKLIVHIHEYSSKNEACKFLLRTFKKARKLIFSNQNDLDKYRNDVYLTETYVDNWLVAPTPSNIVPQYVNQHDRLVPNLIHFGQIRPNKGLELILELYEMIKLKGEIKINLKLIGGIPKGYEKYASQLVDKFLKLGVDVKTNLSFESISGEMSNADFGVFVFPDGVDERRGSVIAALSHDVICFTNFAIRTPDTLKAVTVGVAESSGEYMIPALYERIFLTVADIERIKSDMIPRIRGYVDDKTFSTISTIVIHELGL
ncbi:glycosyltransferase [Vibrio vulnificus]|uniref:glycosyltransferase n=1 Tax=Vibrio vulnificus TaxID=672 RepID=UPI0010298781|nr:glycosyltransferase [Vibrio vulnificus]RZR26585.1 glycosyltransferase family 1 protein [Vibrio vulnificus]